MYSYSPPSLKKKKKRQPIGSSWFTAIFISGLISGVIIFFIGWVLSVPEEHKEVVVEKIFSGGEFFPDVRGFSKPRTILLMGVDMPLAGMEEYQAVRTDTLMLMKVDPRSGTANIVSIPRDSKVYLAKGGGINKINAAFAFGGAELTVKTIEASFGVTVDNYVVINARGIRKLVDTLDGVTVYVEKPMKYRDQTAKLNIDLQPGHQKLTGEEAEGFLRYRHDALGDIGRIRRQQVFLSALAQRLKEPRVLLKVKPLLDMSDDFVRTDMSKMDLVRLVLFAKELERDDIEVATLPGHPSTYSQISYWVIDSEAAEKVLNRLILDTPVARRLDVRVRVGILYTGDEDVSIEGYVADLEAAGMEVICKRKIREKRSQIVVHTAQHRNQDAAEFQKIFPILKDSQLIFSPHGATFETNSCGFSDYTVIFGDDTRSVGTQ